MSAEHIAQKAVELMAHKHEPAGVGARRGA